MRNRRRKNPSRLQAILVVCACAVGAAASLAAWNRAFVQPRDRMVECAMRGHQVASCQEQVYLAWPLARHLAGGASPEEFRAR